MSYGTWRLHRDRDGGDPGEAVKVRGNLTTNDGEIAVNWALDGHGIVLRAEWDIERYLESGRLVQVLPQYRTLVAFLSQTFERFAMHRGER
jgi:DNA-binding transcriptional LysR family regulator